MHTHHYQPDVSACYLLPFCTNKLCDSHYIALFGCAFYVHCIHVCRAEKVMASSIFNDEFCKSNHSSVHSRESSRTNGQRTAIMSCECVKGCDFQFECGRTIPAINNCFCVRACVGDICKLAHNVVCSTYGTYGTYVRTTCYICLYIAIICLHNIFISIYICSQSSYQLRHVLHATSSSIVKAMKSTCRIHVAPWGSSITASSLKYFTSNLYM